MGKHKSDGAKNYSPAENHFFTRVDNVDRLCHLLYNFSKITDDLTPE